MLFGRDREIALLADLVARARGGSAGALVLRGEAGIGKSVLLDSVIASADGIRTLRCQGLESEAPLAFAGLHQLLRPLLPAVDRLAPPQSRALRIAFGQEEGQAVDPFVIALATLALLTDAAESQPVLVVVDDAHWLDAASADALLFTARRLRDDPVALLFAVREGDGHGFVAEGVPDLWLEGLDRDAARALMGEPVPDDVADALIAQTGGNPLALVELPDTLTAEEREGAAPLPEHLRLTDRVQRAFLDRCRRLPEEAQTVLLVAAADDTGLLPVVRQASEALGVTAFDDALKAADHARLLATDGDRVRVAHPLVRSALHQAATGQERRHAHAALADALGDSDQDRRAWHRAAAVTGRDEDIAASLAQVAQRAERSGGHAAAAAAYERAAELTADEEQSAGWLHSAARACWAGGQATRARTLAEAAKARADGRVLRADIDRLRARIEINVGSAATAHHIFLAAARAVADDDPVRALEMRVAATLTHQYNPDVPAAEEPWPAQRDLPTDARTRCLQALLGATTADAAQRWEAAVAALAAAVQLAPEVSDPDVLGNVGNAALHLGDDAGHRRCFTAVLAAARDRGAVMTVLYALPRLAFADLVDGRWDRVRDAADEAVGLAAATGQRVLAAMPLAWLVLLSALRGDASYAELRAQLDEAERRPLGVLADPVHDVSRWAAGVHALQSGDAPGALHHLRRMHVVPLLRLSVLDRIDAAVRAEEPVYAQSVVDDLQAFAEGTGWGWARAHVAYGQALLAEPAEAAEHFETALRLQPRPFELGRTHLAYGELLRRSQRRVDARPHFRAALELFEDLRAAPLAERAAQELRASGETARKRDPSTITALTPMELQVTQLVSQGLSNKDVATQLWISPRTVAFHLRGAFSKLGVSSRGELAQVVS